MSPMPLRLSSPTARRATTRWPKSWLTKHLVAQPDDAQALAHLAHIQMLRKQDAAAHATLVRAEAIAPDDPLILRNRARLALRAQKIEVAALAVARALAADPTDPENRLMQAVVLGAQGQVERAMQAMDALLTERPDFAEALANRALLHLRGRNAAAAMADARRALEIKPHLSQPWRLLASLHAQAMRTEEAFSALRRYCELEPEDAAALADFGELLRQRDLTEEAIKVLSRAVEIAPNLVAAWVSYGVALQQAKRVYDAVRAYEKALALKPDLAEVQNNLGIALKEQGKLDEAVICFRKALELKPDYAEAHNNLGNALKGQGKLGRGGRMLPSARSTSSRTTPKPTTISATRSRTRASSTRRSPHYRQAIGLKPDYAEAHSNLGSALNDQGKLDEAIAAFRQAIGIKPDYAEAHSNLGNALQGPGQARRGGRRISPGDRPQAGLMPRLIPTSALALADQGKLDEAIAAYRQAIDIKPDYAEAHSNLGIALADQGKLDEAIAAYRRAIGIKPDLAEAHSNLGSALQDQGKLEEASAAYRRAIGIKPDLAEAHSNLGSALQDQGKLADAVVSYERALALKPTALEYACRAKLSLPIIASSANAITLQRTRYQAGTSILTALPGTLDAPRKNFASVLFHLAYHNADDRPLMEALCRLFRTKVPALTFVAPHVQDWQPPTNRRRIRVAFLSEFLVFHTIGKLYQGFIRHLDRTHFEVVVIHAPKANRDPFAAQLDGLADKTLKLPVSLAAQQQAVAEEKLDVLFFPDIGMSSATYFLAYSRLAPVQAVSWGHPDTTGLDTLDYFISAETIEPPEADLHYGERLIRLNRLPCCYQPLIAPTTIPTRAALGLPETGTLYGCPQSLFKFHPEFDAVLAEIAAGDLDGYIVVLEGRIATWSDLLRQRWAQSYPILLERVIFLPPQPLGRFMALMAHFDVLLDPIHFGSGNTLYDAMVYGTPIVTWPGHFMRGRIVAGAYRQMRLADAPIVERLEHYAPMALALGRDPVRRGMLRQASLRAAGELFADMRAVREFEAFLIAAVEATGHGDKLPMGWQPAAQEKALA